MPWYLTPRGAALKKITAIHLDLYRSTSGLLGHWLLGMDVLILTTRGKKTKLLRSLPLPYFRDGQDYVVVASNAAQAKHPAWYHNLKADPRATVQVYGNCWAARASVLEGGRRERLWREICDRFQRYEHYQSLTDRQIPLILLEREHGQA